MRLARTLVSAIAIEVAGGEIAAVSSVVNPDKLRHPGPVADLPALLGRAGRGSR